MINYEKFNEILKTKFNNIPRLVTEDLIRFWFIESQNLNVPSVIIEKPYKNLHINENFIHINENFIDYLTNRIRADLYYAPWDTVIEFKYHKKIESSDSCTTTNMGEVFRDLNRLSVLGNKEKYLIYVFDGEMKKYYDKRAVTDILKFDKNSECKVSGEINIDENSNREFYKAAFSSFRDGYKNFSKFNYTVRKVYSDKITSFKIENEKDTSFYLSVFKVE